MVHATRRDFLRVCALGTTACAFASGCSNPSAAAPAQFGDVVAGNVNTLPVGTLQRVGTQPVFVGRDSEGLYAVTSTCTHAGCDVVSQGSNTSALLICPCHGSRFDRNGAVTQGPAELPLVHFAVEVDSGGNVTIHGGTQVSAATRVPVV
jgi:Rieske Fe-S protein